MTTVASRSRADLLLLLVAISWGSTYLTAKELIGPDSVIALLAVRMLVAVALMAVAVILLAARRRRLWRPTASEFRIGGILGVLLSAVFLLETFGIAHTSATNAGLIISLTIVFTPILESVVTKRPLPARFYLAAAGALMGVVLLASGGAFSAPSLGDCLVLLAAIVRAAHVTTMQKLTAGKTLDTASLTVVQMATCAVIFTIGSMFTGQSIPSYLARSTPTDVLLILYLAGICTVFAFFVQMWAVRKTSPTRVSLLLGTEPVWAAIFGLAVAHDRFTVGSWVGLALILGATAWGRQIETRHRLPSGLDSAAPEGSGPTAESRPALVADEPHSEGQHEEADQHDDAVEGDGA